VVRGDILPADVVLRQATINGAKQLNMVGLIGEIVQGAYADILLLKENPLKDITSLDRVKSNQMGVIKGGRVVKSKIPSLAVERACEW
jgi:imidazolonepropionase-like amidohydrolase